MGLFSMLKRNAKLALRKNWGRAVALLLILIAVAVLISILQQVALNIFVIEPMRRNPTMELPAHDTPANVILASFRLTPLEWIIMGVAFLLELLLLAPFSLGIVRWFWGLAHGKDQSVSEVFHFFESGRLYGRALWYDINLSVRSLLWAIPFYLVPGGILGVSVYFLSGKEEAARSVTATASVGIFLSVVLFLLATVFYIACMFRYALTPYFLSETDDTTVSKAIKDSVAYTKGFRFSLMWFSFSFIGWLLLSVFIFPILYTIPYYFASVAMYARYIIEKNRYIPPNATKEFSPEISAPPQDPTPEPETNFTPSGEDSTFSGTRTFPSDF